MGLAPFPSLTFASYSPWHRRPPLLLDVLSFLKGFQHRFEILAIEFVGRLFHRDFGLLPRFLQIALVRVAARQSDVHRPGVAKTLGIILEHFDRFLRLLLA